jgi:hypothetical protein
MVSQRFVLASAVIVILFSGYFVDKIEDRNKAWQLNLDLYRVAFLLLLFLLKKSFLKEIAIALIINHFIDNYFKIHYWSCNDTITTIFIIYKAVIKIKKNK